MRRIALKDCIIVVVVVVYAMLLMLHKHIIIHMFWGWGGWRRVMFIVFAEADVCVCVSYAYMQWYYTGYIFAYIHKANSALYVGCYFKAMSSFQLYAVQRWFGGWVVGGGRHVSRFTSHLMDSNIAVVCCVYLRLRVCFISSQCMLCNHSCNKSLEVASVLSGCSTRAQTTISARNAIHSEQWVRMCGVGGGHFRYVAHVVHSATALSVL